MLFSKNRFQRTEYFLIDCIILNSMILIKLGGSIITNKEKPLSARRKTIDNLVKSLKKINESMIIVHGGGSYGHYWSVKYDMHTKAKKYDLRGVSVVKNSMIELNKIIFALLGSCLLIFHLKLLLFQDTLDSELFFDPIL